MTGRISTSEARRRSADVATLAGADRLDVMKLIAIAGLDPASDFRFENWAGVSFAGLDLTGFDFTGARLHGCDFTGAQIASARFDQAEIGRVIHDPDRDATLPGLVAQIAILRAAADWETFRTSWRRPERLPGDRHLPSGAIFRDAPFAPEMVVLPPGQFWMGSKDGEGDDDERPRHEVTLDYRLAAGRFAVTFDEWDLAKALGGVSRSPNDYGWGRGRRPVIDVSWHDAAAYAAWLSAATGRAYRLLSEAEWEYACRAGTETAFSFGDTITTELANYNGEHTYGSGPKGEYRQRTVDVGSFPANAFGLHDMHGNVWEWCADAWHETYDGAPADGSARTSDDDILSRVLRGGSWYDHPGGLRSAYRNRTQPDNRLRDFGFRLARTLLPSP